MSAIHWGSHVEDPNINSITCCNNSLLECSPAVQELVGSNPGQVKSALSGALVEYVDDPGKFLHNSDADVIHTCVLASS
jgi:hypothetical protein